MIDLFTKEDVAKALDEMHCSSYCMRVACTHFENNEFEKAAKYHENIIRSLRELQRMKDRKEMEDKKQQLFVQIESIHLQNRLIRRLKEIL